MRVERSFLVVHDGILCGLGFGCLFRNQSEQVFHIGTTHFETLFAVTKSLKIAKPLITKYLRDIISNQWFRRKYFLHSLTCLYVVPSELLEVHNLHSS